jgi:hypothetical protein
VAVLGIALIAMGEEIGAEMALRTFGHLVSSMGKDWNILFLSGLRMFVHARQSVLPLSFTLISGIY